MPRTGNPPSPLGLGCVGDPLQLVDELRRRDPLGVEVQHAAGLDRAIEHFADVDRCADVALARFSRLGSTTRPSASAQNQWPIHSPLLFAYPRTSSSSVAIASCSALRAHCPRFDRPRDRARARTRTATAAACSSGAVARTSRAEVIAREIHAAEVGAATARDRPDVALVGLGESSAHALGLIEQIVQEAACPVIALIHAPEPGFVKEAAKRGVFAYITDGDPQDWQNSLEIVLRRFAEYHDLEGAFWRRAQIERAKGILMERHSIDEQSAFALLREHARRTNRKLIDTAAAVTDGHLLLPKQARVRSPGPGARSTLG